MWYDDDRRQTMLREYKSRAEMDREMERAAEKGWRVVSVTDMQQRSGCLRFLSLGLFAIIWKPKSKILVTYSRA